MWEVNVTIAYETELTCSPYIVFVKGTLGTHGTCGWAVTVCRAVTNGTGGPSGTGGTDGTEGTDSGSRAGRRAIESGREPGLVSSPGLGQRSDRIDQSPG